MSKIQPPSVEPSRGNGGHRPLAAARVWQVAVAHTIMWTILTLMYFRLAEPGDRVR